MADYVVNPNFENELRAGVTKALDAAGKDMAADVRRNASWSRTISANVKEEPTYSTIEGPRKRVVIGRDGFISNFFEDGTKQRQTRKGANRGSVSARPHKQPALEAAVRRGLNLSRYL